MSVELRRMTIEMEKLEAQLALATEALEHYANRMDSGGTARRALEQIKKDKQEFQFKSGGKTLDL